MLRRSTQYKERVERNKQLAYRAMEQSRSHINRIGQDFFGSSYNVLIGQHGYPDVQVGLLSVDDRREDYDNPKLWKQKQYGIPDIIGLRGSLINSRFKAHVKTFDQRLTELGQEVALAKNPVDVEINLKRKPFLSFNTGQEITPYGPSIQLKKARITENPSIPRAVEHVLDDELKAAEALNILSKKGFDEYYLSKVLSVGSLGLEQNKKLVPTRWSITATDDTLGKQKMRAIRDHPDLDEQVFFGGHMGNYYLVLCFPGPWSYELFEIDLSTEQYGTDYEPPTGRKGYASETVGGYYASRLAVLEKLEQLKRRGSVLVFRFITDEYWMSMGVWVVREATRTALATKPLSFPDRGSLIRYATLFAKSRFRIEISHLIAKSRLLRQITTQKTLGAFDQGKEKE